MNFFGIFFLKNLLEMCNILLVQLNLESTHLHFTSEKPTNNCSISFVSKCWRKSYKHFIFFFVLLRTNETNHFCFDSWFFSTREKKTISVFNGFNHIIFDSLLEKDFFAKINLNNFLFFHNIDFNSMKIDHSH